MDYPFGDFKLGISNLDYFFGRKDIISEVLHSPFKVRVLLGGRHLGKTSVLNAIRWRLLDVDQQSRNRALPVLFNFQREQPKSLENFLYLLIDRLKETIQNPKEENGFGFDVRQSYRRFLRQISNAGVNLFGIKLNVSNPDGEQKLSNSDFRQDLKSIFAKLQNHNCQGVCFLFDGTEYLVKQDWANDACSYFRSLKDTTDAAIEPFLGLFLSGYRDVKDYHQAVSSPLFNMAEIRWLSTLTITETKELIIYRCQKENCSITEEGINEVLKWAGGHPYLTNQMLNAMFENKKRSSPLPYKGFLRSLIKEHHKKDFSPWWDENQRSYGFGETEQTIYLALIKEEKVTAESLEDKINYLSLSTIEYALEVLAGTGVIQQLDYETYTVGTKLFSQWVLEEKVNRNSEE